LISCRTAPTRRGIGNRAPIGPHGDEYAVLPQQHPIEWGFGADDWFGKPDLSGAVESAGGFDPPAAPGERVRQWIGNRAPIGPHGDEYAVLPQQHPIEWGYSADGWFGKPDFVRRR
jgi:hypothetical protein